jgi:hypothetical protein
MLYSTKYNTNNSQKLTTKIFKILSKKNKVTIISAFYSTNTIEELLKTVSPETDVTIIVSSLGSNKILDQVDELKRIKLRKKQIIKIYDKSHLLHSKIYYGTSNNINGSVIFIGSANLSNGGFNKNEEILVKIESKDTKKEIIDYIKLIDNESISINSKKLNIQRHKNIENDIIDYINNGYIVFKPSISYTLNYTDNYLKSYTNDLSAQQTIRNTKIEQKSSLDISNIAGITDHIEKLSNYSDIEDDSISEKSNRIHVRNNCIETCLGYWLPKSKYEEFTEKNRKSQAERKNNLLIILEKLEVLISDTFKLDKIIDDLTEDLISYNPESGLDKSLLYKEIRSGVEKHINTKIRYLKNNKKRLIEGLYISPMPYIWDDSVSSSNFIETFISDVKERSGGSRPVKNMLAKEILDNFNLDTIGDNFDNLNIKNITKRL